MTQNGPATDPVMDEITAAVGLGHKEPDTARAVLVATWGQIGPAGDPFHRCVLAHYLADLHDEPAEALMWDVRALDAADTLSDSRARQHHASLQVAGFYPSLQLNIADNLRRLGAFAAAAEHLDEAEKRSSALGADGYGDIIRTGIKEVRRAVGSRDTAPRPSAPGSREQRRPGPQRISWHWRRDDTRGRLPTVLRRTPAVVGARCAIGPRRTAPLGIAVLTGIA